MQILKFGGTSVGKPDRMKRVAQIIHNDQKKVVVLSALSGVTNALVDICHTLHAQKPEEAMPKIDSLQKHHETFVSELLQKEDYLQTAHKIIQEHFILIKAVAQAERFSSVEERIILAQGELLSTKFFHTYLNEIGLEANLLMALDFMKINEEKEPDLPHIIDRLKPKIEAYSNTQIFITQGYICLNHQGEVDNLQRGGSDYTASLIGAALQAENIQIWTDIDGMHNNDPRFVSNTFPVKQISFDEAAELAYFGAKILHPATIRPAQQFNIPVKLLNTMQPEAKGTIIHNKSSEDSHMVTSIAAKDHITAIKIKSSRMLMAYGFLRKIFEIFEKYKTPIDMITTSEVAVSLTIDDDRALPNITTELKSFGTVEIDQEQTIICVVGSFVSERPEMAFKVFDSLKDIPLRMISFGGSRHNISVLVNTPDKEKALNLLNEGLF